MNESIHINPENVRDHPNLEFEENFKSLQSIIELGNCADDFENLNYLRNIIFRKKFDSNDIKILNELKSKYLQKGII